MEDAKAFEDFISAKESNVIGIGRSASELKGIGTEYLVIDGTVIAKFFNGQMIVTRLVVDAKTETVTSA